MEGLGWAAKTEVEARAVARAAEVTWVATEAAKEVEENAEAKAADEKKAARE
jgi:hypothetical protein